MKYNKISFYLYHFIILAFYLAGFVYLSRQAFMPYHGEAIGLTWEQVNPAMQILILAGIHGIGGLLVAIATVLATLLYFPFKQQQFWAKITIALIAFMTIATLIGIVLSVKFHTPAHPPLIPLLILMGLLFLAITFSFIGHKK